MNNYELLSNLETMFSVLLRKKLVKNGIAILDSLNEIIKDLEYLYKVSDQHDKYFEERTIKLLTSIAEFRSAVKTVRKLSNEYPQDITLTGAALEKLEISYKAI
ncbi:hypothetical protein [Serratia quinivorans]|uniref:hypothetical protein n=1 Tax=Serratia quinivorans TaxID=137545 RepID=UPI00217AFDAC|nr:hypothetical protein [Serratia quinivorans]CAI1113904.1 Uncharacterised protein [Serratia quinivorans]CAI2073928.1 Uncharacterised protein [Serratia quinivorans]